MAVHSEAPHAEEVEPQRTEAPAASSGTSTAAAAHSEALEVEQVEPERTEEFAVRAETSTANSEAPQLAQDERERVEEHAASGEKSTTAPSEVHKHMEEHAGEPQKPKGPYRAYVLFSNSMRDEVLKEAEASTIKGKFGEAAKIIASRWRALSKEEMAVWKEREEADKRRYESEMQTYNELLDPVGTLRAKYEHLMPKKPSAFSHWDLFAADTANQEKALALLTVEGKPPNKNNLRAALGGMWRALSSEEKAPIYDQVTKARLEYEEKLKVWLASPECKELGKAVSVQALREREGKEKSTPKKRPSDRLAETTPDAKKPRPTVAKGKAAVKEIGPTLDENVLKKATKLGLESAFRNLASRAEVIASGKSAAAILKSLQASGGLVNPAKRALLGC